MYIIRVWTLNSCGFQQLIISAIGSSLNVFELKIGGRITVTVKTAYAKTLQNFFLVKRDCTRVAPVELSIDPCISLTMTNTFHDHPDYPINRSHRHLGNTNRMLIFLRTYTFCQFSRELPRSFHSESKAECNPNNLFVLANLFSLKTINIGLEWSTKWQYKQLLQIPLR